MAVCGIGGGIRTATQRRAKEATKGKGATETSQARRTEAEAVNPEPRTLAKARLVSTDGEAGAHRRLCAYVVTPRNPLNDVELRVACLM